MIAEKVKALEEENENLKKVIRGNNHTIAQLTEKCKKFEDCCLMVLPKQMYHCKKRRNTTVVFQDGSQITVKRKIGDRNCLETALAYAVLKQLISRAEVNKIIRERKEIRIKNG